MESRDMELDFNRSIVNQGITVLGNKGSTDLLSYIQHLWNGLNDSFVTFIEMLVDGHNWVLMVEEKVTAGDFLHWLYHGRRQVLAEADRESLTIPVKDVRHKP